MHSITRFLLTSVLAVASIAVTNSANAAPDNDQVIAAWVQYTDGGVEARAVVTDHCPTLIADGHELPMVERAPPTAAHPNFVCAANLPQHLRSLWLGVRRLPVPVATPRRIVVMGDTGCRLSAGHGLYQECNNDSLWPLANVARSIEALDPDLIIHTGDYIYRESPCPVGDNGCVGSPYGDTQATWEAEWLIPAQPVHSAAPLILVRGNHEICSRAGNGWFRYLDARPYPLECMESTDPWVVTTHRLQVAVMDVANIDDPETGEPLDSLFEDQLVDLDNQLSKSAWIAAHRTFWGYGADDDSGELTTPTEQLQDAVRMVGLPATTQLLVGAHIHLAEVLDFGGQRPPQLVVANSGTQLVPRIEPPEEIDGIAIQSQEVIYQFGFVSMVAVGYGRWRMEFRDVDGRKLEQCNLNAKRVSCRID